MYSLSQLASAVKAASNMVEIEAAILTETFNRHSCTFAKHVERPNGNQSAWINRVCSEMGNLIAYDQRFLFSLIPSRFQKVEMYKRLALKINYPVS